MPNQRRLISLAAENNLRTLVVNFLGGLQGFPLDKKTANEGAVYICKSSMTSSLLHTYGMVHNVCHYA